MVMVFMTVTVVFFTVNEKMAITFPEGAVNASGALIRM